MKRAAAHNYSQIKRRQHVMHTNTVGGFALSRKCVDNVMGRGKCRDTYLEHEKQHEELGHFTTLTDVPKPKEFIVRTEFADADAEATTTAAESDESLDEDDITGDFQADDSPGKSHVH
jgi:hypothetical protein